MKILIFGGGGMLGHKLVHSWKEKFDVWATVRSDFGKYEKFEIFERDKFIENVEIENTELLEDIFIKVKPDVVINAVGVIKQLPSSKDVVNTLTINSIFPHRLAEISKRHGARLICISTDCVFSGRKGGYTEEDSSDADDLYGKSKNLGEVIGENCLTLRTSIIGRELFTQHSLTEWFLSNRGGRVKGFVNAIYSGFPTTILADILADIIENQTHLEGLYHVSSEPINKFELLKLINDAYRADIEIEPETDFKIDRSLNSDKFRLKTNFQPPEWSEMIERMARDNDLYR
jgi:dTDP-4-dehydrorhamnose reductase